MKKKKTILEKHNPVTDSTKCSVYDFNLDPYSNNGWFDHVAKSEHLSLRNIYSPAEMILMGVDNFLEYRDDLISMLNIVSEFEEALQDGQPSEDVINFIDFDWFAETFFDIKERVEKISLPKKLFIKYSLKEKAISFLYSNMINFRETNKITGVPMSKKFLSNLTGILTKTKCAHHSHITGNIYGYAHTFCNKNVRENYYEIPVIAHNLFRFDFLFLVKGLRASVWKTKDIIIGGKNPTDISFAHIANQVQFVDTIK